MAWPTKHGEAGQYAYENNRRASTPEYRLWCKMVSRCHSVSDKDFPRYGGIGIRVCRRWRTYSNFLADMGRRPTPDHSLDRFPDKGGGYRPGNVRWATRVMQQNNMRSNRLLTVHGKTMTVAEWARLAKVSYETLRSRLRLGWPVSKAVAPPYTLEDWNA